MPRGGQRVPPRGITWRRAYCGGPSFRVMLAVLCWPDGVTQVRDTVSPGRNFDSAVCSVCGAPTAWPLTLMMTDPAVTPAFAAGLAQIVPMTRVPELTWAIESGTGRSESLE
jgi:hypothetical protein